MCDSNIKPHRDYLKLTCFSVKHDVDERLQHMSAKEKKAFGVPDVQKYLCRYGFLKRATDMDLWTSKDLKALGKALGVSSSDPDVLCDTMVRNNVKYRIETDLSITLIG